MRPKQARLRWHRRQLSGSRRMEWAAIDDDQDTSTSACEQTSTRPSSTISSPHSSCASRLHGLGYRLAAFDVSGRRCPICGERRLRCGGSGPACFHALSVQCPTGAGLRQSNETRSPGHWLRSLPPRIAVGHGRRTTAAVGGVHSICNWKVDAIAIGQMQFLAHGHRRDDFQLVRRVVGDLGQDSPRPRRSLQSIR
jgi:hypothetical protein